MIKRLVAFLILVALFGGGIWYFFRDTPHKRIQRWRTASKYFLESSSEIGNPALDLAAEYNDKILSLVPESSRDLMTRARILLRRNQPGDVEEASEILDKVAHSGRSGYVVASLYRASAFRHLGRYSDSLAAAHSVVDRFPFRAHIEMSRTAIATRSYHSAVRYLTRARDEFAESPLEKADAAHRLASVYSYLADDAEDEESTARHLAQSLNSIDIAEKALLSFAPSTDAQMQHTEGRLYQLIEARLSVSPDSKDAIVKPALEKIDVWSDRHRRSAWPRSRDNLVTRGLLQVRTIRDEKDAFADPDSLTVLKEHVIRNLSSALFNTTSDEAQKMNLYDTSTVVIVEPDAENPTPDVSPEAKQRREYVSNLIRICVYLSDLGASEWFLNSNATDTFLTSLELPQRLAHGMNSPDPEVAQVFRGAKVFALLEDGPADEAHALSVEYLESAPPEDRSKIARRMTLHLLATRPEIKLSSGESFAFKLFDKMKATTKDRIKDTVGHLELLQQMEQFPALEKETQVRLKLLKSEVMTLSRTHSEYNPFLVHLIGEVTNTEEAIRYLEEFRQKNPEAPVSEQLANLYRQRADEAGEPTQDSHLAMTEHLRLFAASPLRPDTTEALKQMVSDMDENDRLPAMSSAVRALFPTSVEVHTENLSRGLVAMLLEDAEKARMHLDAVGEASSYGSLLAYLRGSTYTKLAEARNPGAIDTELVEKAREAFEAFPEFLPSQLSLLRLQLSAAVRSPEPIPNELLKEIKSIHAETDLYHHGSWLLAQARYERFKRMYRDEELTNSPVLGELRKMRAAIRQTIDVDPNFERAYLLLARSFVAADEAEKALKNSGSNFQRHLMPADYERAITVLRSSPRNTVAVFSELASYLQRAGRVAESVPYLETLALVDWSSKGVSRLLNTYLLLKDYDSVRLTLLDLNETEAPSELVSEATAQLMEALTDLPRDVDTRLAFLETVLLTAHGQRPVEDEQSELSAKEFRTHMLTKVGQSVVESPLGSAFRHSFLAQSYGQLASDTAGATTKRRLRATSLAHYQQAIEAYQASDAKIPVQILNNYAWNLLHEEDTTVHAKALEYAKEAFEQFEEAPATIVDTYAWALHQNNSLVRAESLYRELLESHEKPEYRVRFAHVLSGLRKYSEAKEVLRVALRTPRFEGRTEAKKLQQEIHKIQRQLLGKSDGAE